MKKPTFFGKYLLLERVNVGGMAEVFIAKAFGVEGFERILAIKKILPTMAEDDEFITMFIDEARISVQLNHANIVHIHELGKHEDTYFIAMEYVAGRDVRTLLERYRRRKEIMPTAQAVFIVSKMCEGLDYAHRKKDARGQDLHIIHRDVSPQNILVSYEGEVKIIDFGIAKAANRSQKTQAGILKGKFGYMSPEQVRGMPIDRRSDVFAVGVLLYEMLTGEKLFVGESDFSTLEKVRNADIPLPREFNPNISAGLEKVVLKALAREPEDRYQWASDLQEDLMRFLLAGDAIYSSKHLSGFMKEAFAEDMLREAEKMERYASVERPDQIEHSGVTLPPPAAPPPRATAQKRSPAPSATGSPVGRASTAPAQPAPGYIPPPSAEELAEMDGAADKTQIVDSTHALRAPETRIADSSVVVDDSITGRSENPIDRAGHHTSASPYAQDEGRGGKGKSGPKSQVIIGDEGGEAYAGATMIGPAPTAPPSRSRGGSAAPVLDPEEEETTGNITVPVGSRHNGLRAQAAEEDPDGAYDDQGDEYEGDGQEDYGDEGQDAEEPPYDDEADGPATIPQKASKMAKPAPAAKVQKAKAPAGPKKPLPKPAIIGMAAGAALLLIVAVIFVVRGSSTGSVNFVAPVGATVLVDGEAVNANQVIELSAGIHNVTASAPGYQPVTQQIEVTAGQAAAPILLSLKVDAPPQKPPEPKPPEPTPPPVVDNTPPPTTPETPPDKPVEPPAPKTFTALFEGQEGAEITVDGKSLGKLPGAKLGDLEVGKKYTFTAKRAGFKPFSGDFTSSGNTEVRVAVDMVEEAPPPEPKPKPPPPEPKPKPPPVAVTPTPKPPPEPKPKPAAAAMGKFACSTSPTGAQIWVDGKNTGRLSPVTLGNPLSLPVGKHKVVFKLNGKSTKPQVVVIEAEGVAKLINVPVN
ncbi:protein kinase [Corallococcus exiguus]|uniref:protein kinase domain-containing protein n=1 Tax=Corallococcus TaxID=83461 RepID=UPI000EC67E1C|nr:MULTISPECIES: protein kinase [Corallococcus]NNB88981.1 protein kinase [Corallococcus exiguus]NNC06761.1 protein kinase [Corallococcus exiguus]NPC50504.1 protein kinase [Corallococcus exiguus]RKH81194.1 PEGA domain-containing protein [Corallococcus sp. AB032C]